MKKVQAAVARTIINASTSSLKRIAWAFGCAPKGSDEERQLRELLLDRAKIELEHRDNSVHVDAKHDLEVPA